MRSERLVLLLAAVPLATAAAETSTQPTLPLVFEENRGQAAAEVRYLCRREGHDLFLTVRGAVLTLGGTAQVEMLLEGIREDADLRGEERLPGHSNYLLGNEPARWRTGVPHFAAVRHEEALPGIDMLFHGRGALLEYDFIVAPGADPSAITLRFRGADSLRVEPNGDLVLETAAGPLRQRRPVAWQELEGARVPVEAAFRLLRGNRAGFELGPHDPSLPLVIDPVIVFATYLGGSSFDWCEGMGIFADGSVVVAGPTSSADFPTENPLFGDMVGEDVFVARLSADGSALLFATYLGGLGGSEQCLDLALDGNGNIALTGFTNSSDFPVAGAYQPNKAGATDAFVTLLSPAGALLYSSFIGSVANEKAHAVAFAANGDILIAGEAGSGFPTTNGAYQENAASLLTDGFLCRFDPVLGGPGSLLFSTFFGGSGVERIIDLVVDPVTGKPCFMGRTSSGLDLPVTGNAVQGQFGGAQDAFAARMNVSGSALEYCTYLGGTGSELSDFDGAIFCDTNSDLFLCGSTRSGDFPTTAGSYQTNLANAAGIDDLFVAKLDPDAPAGGLLWSTLLGGANADVGRDLTLGADGTVWVTGKTNSPTFPVVDPLQGISGMPAFTDAICSRLSADGSALLFSTTYGGNGNEDGHNIGFSAAGDLYLSGWTGSGTFDSTFGAFQTEGTQSQDGFVTRIDLRCETPELYGTPAAGSGGFTPTIAGYGGCPAIGSAAFRIDCEQVLGGAQGVLIIGVGRSAVPFRGAFLLVDLTLPHVLVPIAASGPAGAAGAGEVHFLVPVPNQPQAVGLEVDAQLAIFDPGAALGLATSPGLAFVISDAN